MDLELWDKNLCLLLKDKHLRELQKIVGELKWPVFTGDFSLKYKNFKEEYPNSMDENCTRQTLIKVIDENRHAWECYLRYKHKEHF